MTNMEKARLERWENQWEPEMGRDEIAAHEFAESENWNAIQEAKEEMGEWMYE